MVVNPVILHYNLHHIYLFIIFITVIHLFTYLFIYLFIFCLPGITIEANGARQPVDNGNKTEWSPIRSVIIRVINSLVRNFKNFKIVLSELSQSLAMILVPDFYS